jgi:lambda family phage portal protein
MPVFDSIISFFSPRAAYRRKQYRNALAIVDKKRKYEGASKGRRLGPWRTGSTSANTENSNAIETLRNRARDMVRNNSYAARAVSVIASNVVGKGILPNLVGETDAGTEELRAAWQRWAAKPANFDLDCCIDFNGMQSLIMRSVVESGEVLVRRRRVDPSESPFGIKLQVLEADHLATNHTVLNSENGNRIIQGVEVDENGCPVAYHLYKNHPGGTGAETTAATVLQTERVPADDIAHVFLKRRPGQVRDVTWFANVMVRLRELDEFEDAELVRQKVAACFAAFIEDIEPPEDMSSGDEFDLEKLEPGIIEHLPPGKRITFGTPPMPQSDSYKFFVSSQLRAIAAGLGVSYEALSGDLSEVNFSSARMGWLEFQRNIDVWRWNLLIPQFNDRVLGWFLESVSIAIGATLAEGVTNTWTAPRREMIDPTKEVPAKIKAIRAGIETLSDSIRQTGKEPGAHLAELAADNRAVDELGLVLDSDPRKVTASGALQASNEGNQATEAEDEG